MVHSAMNCTASTPPCLVMDSSLCHTSLPFPEATQPTPGQDLSSGFKFPFDNFDLFQKVCDMTQDNQNKDIHWVNHNAVKNRISGNNLSDDGPICDLEDLDNVKLLPSTPDHVMQRENYITLVERVITDELPYLHFCKDEVMQHIPHTHSKEMAQKSDKVIIVQ